MSTDASAELPEAAAAAGSWRVVLYRIGAIVGAFGLAAVVIGALAMGAVQRAAVSYAAPAAVAEVLAEEPVREGVVPDEAMPDAVRPTPQPDPEAAVAGPARRIDPVWAARTAAATGIPRRALLAYSSAVLTVNSEQPSCGISWNTVAAIGAVESGHATHGGARLTASGVTRPAIVGPALNGDGVAAIRDTDAGAWDQDPVWDRAVGPMQFIPSTWRRWGADGNADGRADPNQIDDAALAAARYLCASGPMNTSAGWRQGVFAYNHSDSYVRAVADTANRYAAAVGR